MKLDNKVAIITGGAAGIGRAMAKCFAEEGAHVVVGDINGPALHETTEEIKKAGGSVTSVEIDCATSAGAETLVSTAVQECGRLDVLCNNAGILDGLVPAAECSDELWNDVIRINMTGPMQLSREALSVMLPQGSGVILNTSSVASNGGGRGGVAYTAAKHGINGLTRSVAWYYGDKGIRCNAIEPGAILTPMAMAKIPNQGGMEKMAPYLPMIQRYGEPAEVAQAALFLVSDDSRYVNGSILTIDGGWTPF